MNKEKVKIVSYIRSEKEMNEEQQRNAIIEELKQPAEILQIYKLHDSLANRLNRLKNKIPGDKVKARVYINSDRDLLGKSKKKEKIMQFCDAHKLNVEKIHFAIPLMKNYMKGDLIDVLNDAIKGEFNTFIVLNSKELGESTIINTYIINEIFTKYGIRFIDIEQKVDTNFDETLARYENPINQRIMDDIIEAENKIKIEFAKMEKEVIAKRKKNKTK